MLYCYGTDGMRNAGYPAWMGARRKWTLLLAFACGGCALDRNGLMQVAPDAEAPGDDASATIDAATTADAGGQEVGTGGVDAAERADASPTKDASPGGNDSSTTIDGASAGDAPATGYPATCAQAGATSGDQDVTLYVGGDPGKPWTAHCSGGNAYLTLGSSSSNFSSYPGGGCAGNAHGPKTVTTTWTMLRIDPTTLVVDTSDYTGAISSGDTHEVSGNGSVNTDYTSMPYGSARSCVDQAPGGAAASVDFTGTPFAVDASQQWYLLGWSNNNGGNQPFGGASPSSGKTVTLSVGGYPGGITPCQSDYYQNKGGACLQLVYSP
jgi:hypothetical protein